MPSTSPYGFEYEAGESETPGRTLHGADGTSAILAEQVNDELQRVDEDIADLQTQVGRGWVPIASGSFSGAPPFTIDATADGDYPAGTFASLRLRAYGSLVGDPGHVTVRINDDTTSNLHNTARIRDLADGSGATDSGWSEGSVFRVARWGTLDHASNFECIFFGTHVQSRVPFVSHGGAIGTSAAASSHFRFWGRLTADRLVSSLRISTFDLSSDISEMNWELEGYAR